MYGKILSLPLRPVTTCGKIFISAVWQGFEFTFVLIIFAKLFPICLLHLINIPVICQYCAPSNPRDLMFNIFA